MRTLYKNFTWALDGSRQDMLVADGRVVDRSASVEAQDIEVQDLNGRLLTPAFVDNHCHILPTGLDLSRLSLLGFDTKEQVMDAVRDRLPSVEPGRWLRTVQYDQTRFPDGEHLTRHDLDAISGTVPILLRHSSGHASVANSAALTAAGIDASTPDPKGGTFVRDPDGRPNGVLLETAHEKVSAAAPKPTVQQMVKAILAAGNAMADLGISAACDMMTGQYDLEQELQAYRLAAEQGCRIKTRLYLQWATVFGPRALPKERLEELVRDFDGDQCAVSGVKIFADGAIGSSTAAVHEEFTTGGKGQLIYEPDRLNGMVRTAHDAGWQIAIHSIGDRSTDLVMDAYEALDDPRRHRIEHAMILSDLQIERMARLGIFCTMQPEFLARFGHAYRRNLGEPRASKLKRARSVLDAGIPLSFSSDRPIVGGDPLDGIRTASKRPEGFDQGENITALEALRAYTMDGARAFREEGLGGLEPGHAADFLVAEPRAASLQEVIEKGTRFSRKTVQNLEPAPIAGRLNS